MAKINSKSLHEFEYHYSFKITDEHLRNGSAPIPAGTATARQQIPITYYADKSRTKPIDGLKCNESVSGFHRKLVFNLLSKLPKQVKSAKLSAKYCYVVFREHGFLFCIDVVVYQGGDGPIPIPAQYLYEEEVKGGTSTIDEYLSNLAVVWDRVQQGIPGPFDEKNRNSWPYFAGFIEDTFVIQKVTDGIKFEGTGKLMRHPLGEFVGLVPIPKFGSPTTIADHGIVVGSLAKKTLREPLLRRQPTPSVQSALKELTRILWGDGGLTTWIMGQPGTGKEVYAQALHHGSGRVKNGQKSSKTDHEQIASFEHDSNLMGLTSGFAVQSLASVTLEEFNQRLFAVPRDAKSYCVVDVIDDLNGTIFLDEFDKPKDPFLIYSALLRVLEAKQYIKRTYSATSGQVQDTPSKFKNVNWIFAGAFTQIDPREHVPFDLWSRLKGFIHLRNPLEDDPNYGATLFLYWHLRLVAEILDENRGLTPLMNALCKNPAQRNYREHVACTLLGQAVSLSVLDPFLPSTDLEGFAMHFQQLLNKKTTFSGDRLDSPRGIFRATEAAFNFLREKAFHGEANPLAVEAIRDDALEEAHKCLRLSRGPS